MGHSAFVRVGAGNEYDKVPGTLGELLLAASATYGDDVALQVRRGLRYERISYVRAADLARRVAAWSVARGLAPGDRIAVRAPNMPEYVLLYLGAWLAGLVVVPIDVRTRPEVVTRIIADSGARIVFGSALIEDGAAGPAGTYALEELVPLVAGCAPLADLPRVAASALAVIAYTSGTTGTPKGVMLTHANLLAETAALARAYPLRRGLVALSILPLSHIYELTVTFLHGFTSGIRVTYLPRTNAATIARAMATLRVEGMTVVPELLRLMRRDLERRGVGFDDHAPPRGLLAEPRLQVEHEDRRVADVLVVLAVLLESERERVDPERVHLDFHTRE